MNVRRFVAANSREALRLVRSALGDDALILANRQIDDGVEILAVAESAVPPLEQSNGPAVSTAPPRAQPTPPPPARPGDSAMTADSLYAMSERLFSEMNDMRQLLAREQGGRPPVGDCRARLRRQLLTAGFSALLADELLAAMPTELAEAQADDERPMAWLQRRLRERLVVLDDEEAFLDEDGVVALVGSTGVGKTTTTAKLAARYVMRHGVGQVDLVSIDSFRIGAHEQLRIYARLLNVPSHALDAEQPLDELLGGLRSKRRVIIDTVGMSQRDQRVIDQIARLGQGAASVRLVLLLNAASQPDTLEEIVTTYRQAARAAGTELSDCLVTKLDEAGRLGPLLDTVIRHGLRLLFVSDGQRVPEDLALIDPAAVVARALAPPLAGEAPELTAITPSPAASWAHGVLGQGRRAATALAALRARLGGFVALEAAWDLGALPASLREQRLDALLAEHSQPALQVSGVLWARRGALSGCDWSMPNLAIDARGGWLALPLLQHRQPADQTMQLAGAHTGLGATAHLLPALPAAGTWAWLDAGGHAWVAQARSTQRVSYGGERQSLAQLAALALAAGQHACRWRGRPARLLLSQLAVAASPAGQQAESYPLRAWFGEICADDSSAVLGRRYWLAPAGLGDDVAPLLLGQLYGEAVPPLTRRAWQRLPALTAPRCDAELRLLLAAGLAAVACHLDQAGDDWAMDLRAELAGLLGGRRRSGATALLDALMYLFATRDTLRHALIPDRAVPDRALSSLASPGPAGSGREATC